MIVTKAVATVQPYEEDVDTYPNGAFDIILSAQTKDRDGDTLTADEWKMPLPDHITMDLDHGMSVASTVGSGKPFINPDGDLQVRGGYASIPRAQEVRALVNERHIRTTSVAFMTEKNQKDTNAKPVRELLNGAFVSIPSNREAVILSSKAFDTVDIDVKVGARNNATDAAHIQAMHDSATHLGAVCPSSGDEPKSLTDGVTVKATVAELLTDVDVSTLPPAVQQALKLAQDDGVVVGDSPSADPDVSPGTPAPADEAPAPVSPEAVALRGRALLLTSELDEQIAAAE